MRNNKSKKRRGAVIIEYALILALIVAVGLVFASDKGLGNSITGVFSKVEQMLGLGSSEDKQKSTNLLAGMELQASSWQGKGTNLWETEARASTKEILTLDSYSTYVYTLDISDFPGLETGVLLFNDPRNTNGSGTAAATDSSWISQKTIKDNEIKAGVTATYDNNKYTITFTTGEKNVYFAANFKKNGGSDFSEAERSQLNTVISKATLVKQ